jgi:hypothetical protein
MYFKLEDTSFIIKETEWIYNFYIILERVKETYNQK